MPPKLQRFDIHNCPLKYMKKLFSWLWSKKQQEPEYFFEPVWTPYEENERKYEARQKRERDLLAKYGNR